VFRTPADAHVGPGTLFVRYGIGLLGVLAGIVVLVLNPSGLGVDGFGLLEGAGLSVLMLNWIYRIGVAGDHERDREEDARRYLEEHGHWPDETERRRSRPPNAGPRG
jgi:hypothetical protein